MAAEIKEEKMEILRQKVFGEKLKPTKAQIAQWIDSHTPATVKLYTEAIVEEYKEWRANGEPPYEPKEEEVDETDVFGENEEVEEEEEVTTEARPEEVIKPKKKEKTTKAELKLPETSYFLQTPQGDKKLRLVTKSARAVILEEVVDKMVDIVVKGKKLRVNYTELQTKDPSSIDNTTKHPVATLLAACELAM